MPKKVPAYHLGEIPYSSPKIVTATNAKIRKAFFICMMPPSRDNAVMISRPVYGFTA